MLTWKHHAVGFSMSGRCQEERACTANCGGAVVFHTLLVLFFFFTSFALCACSECMIEKLRMSGFSFVSMFHITNHITDLHKILRVRSTLNIWRF
jgi:hypothetical protein